MKNIYIIRHGHSQSNAGQAAMPNADIALTEIGYQQANEVAEWVIQQTHADITSIGVSEYLRTQQTALPLEKATGVKATVIAGLHEFNYLCFANIDGLTLLERRSLAEDYWLTAQPEDIDGAGAESFLTFVQRVQQVRHYFNTLATGNHVVYTHGLWISMLIWQLLNQPTDTKKAMKKFRQFELSIRTKNTEAFLLTMAEEVVPAIVKVRSRA